jgi:hypothetical protein
LLDTIAVADVVAVAELGRGRWLVSVDTGWGDRPMAVEPRETAQPKLPSRIVR